MSAYHIKPASAEELPEVHRLLKALARETDSETALKSELADLQRHYCGPHPHFRALLARNTVGTAVGLCLYFTQFSTWRGSLGLYIQDLYVAQETRGSGLGKRLIQCAIEDCAELSVTHVRLMVDTHNHAAQSFYQRLGFEHSLKECIYVCELP